MEKSNGNGDFCNCLYFALNAFTRNVNRIAEEEFGPSGLAPSQAFLLMAVVNEPGILIGTLSEILHLQYSTISRFVDKLEARNLAKRETNGRITKVYPTTDGSILYSQIKASWENLYLKLEGVLGQNNLTELTNKINTASELLSNGIN